jgi:hypothetical protein
MSTSLEHDSGNIYQLRIEGVLRKADLDQCQAQLVKEMVRVGSVRLLCVLERFEGWEPNPDWNDLTFFVKHRDDIERIAIVGDERWRSLSMMFASVDLRRAPVEFFPVHGIAEARAWLVR